MLHEVGYAFDEAFGDLFKNSELLSVWRKNRKKIRHSYFRQTKGLAGASETFAEMYAMIIGDASRDETVKMFDEATDPLLNVMKKILKGKI
ncbi:MAG: hypothetical protein QGG73_10695 [Candidatus Hydrogenedentes bacterium]|jgi:hypothetical protein|nr:hypothetical protein [Candidatus Hydrogenedentota bacterium]